ncbi:LOW QUALITY PROTEIN: sister chromatid cohesion protein PDS5 homolog A-like [Nymphaea colorata]|nr:LOW QUALITY PROTEIN: sister chromatid cohesion protein PDS5 homolog A-like [Nymphaea colorata]
MAQNLRQKLKEVGSKLEKPPQSKASLLKLLKQAEICLSEIDQSPSKSLLGSVQSCANTVAKEEYLKHQDRDVQLLVAACICETMRIMAPEPPYTDDVLKEAFSLIVGTLTSLSEINSPSFGRSIAILETLGKYRSCVVLLDLECNDLVREIFTTFLSVASNDHPEAVLMSMQSIMVLLIDESEDVQEEPVLALLAALGQQKKDISSAGRRLAMNVIKQCAVKLEPCINKLLISALSRTASSQNGHFDHHEAIYEIYCGAPQILHGVVAYMIEELSVDQLDVRLKSVNLLGRIFSLPESNITEVFRPLFLEFLKKLTDSAAKVRISAVEHVKACLLCNFCRPDAAEIISALADRLSDHDEHVREQAVAAICDVIKHTSNLIPVGTVKLVSERLQDKSITVKRYTQERLVELYRLRCLKCSDPSFDYDEYKWLPRKILRCFYDNDLRYETLDIFLSDSLIPTEITVKDYMKHWIAAFSEFEKIETKAFEQVLLQRKRLQEELQSYLMLRKKYQDNDAPDILKRTLGCVRAMSRLFKDPSRAEESFQMLNQLKDDNVWKTLTSLLDYNIGTAQSLMARDDLLKAIGDKHPLYDFLATLSIKCSYILFNKEHVKEILDELLLHKSAGNGSLVLSCLNLLVILASFFPSIFRGAEEQLVLLLKDDNETIKEGIVHILAKAGGSIRDQLPMLAGSVDILLERLCLEGTRKQAKYSVQALAAITIDDGLKSLSLLYKHLVDMLEKKTHLPAILQSLGCIAQIAMPIFETREEEIVGFISDKIMDGSIVESTSQTDWDDKSEKCLLKIFAIKTLVKSYLPVKDAHVRSGIENLLEMLKGVLTFGEVSQGVESSAVDKAHLRLASATAILRLSKVWDHKIPIDVFHLTVRISQDIYPQVRKLFLSKVYQYAKDRLVDAKYVIALPLGMDGMTEHEYKEYRQCLVEIVEMLYREARSRQLYVPSGQNVPSDYPEHILAYFVHSLAHDDAYPNLDERPSATAFVPIYRKLHTFLSVLLHQNEKEKQEAICTDVHDRACAIISVFQSIKSSADLVDLTKSKNSHVICDIGLGIMKHLCSKQFDTDLTNSIPLPSVLYGPVEKSNDRMANGDCPLSWLSRDDLFVHFQSLSLQTGAQVEPAALKDKKKSKPRDKDETELPLKKMMKMLKSNKSKKKATVTPTSLGSTKKQEDDLDILSMVKEIESENLTGGKSLEVGELATSLDREETINGENNGDVSVSQRNDIKINKEANVRDSNYKRKDRDLDKLTGDDSVKSNKKHKKLEDNLNGGTDLTSESVHVDHSSNHLEGELSIDRVGVRQSNETDLTETAVRTGKRLPSRGKRKSTTWTLEDDIHNDGEAKHNKKVGSSLPDEKFSSTRGYVRSTKKSKRKSAALLEKCSFGKADKSDLELIGCRVKVWWPMDKRFYKGVVQSFDVSKKKHVIVYDDGDVETLKLEKEKWERINDDDDDEEQEEEEGGGDDDGNEDNDSGGDMLKQPESSTPSTSQQKSSRSRIVKRGRAASGKRKRKVKKKENSSNSSVKASLKSSKTSSPSQEAESEDASQHSDLHDQDGSRPIDEDHEEETKTAASEALPERENGDDDLKVTNEDNTIDEDKLQPSSSQIIEGSKEKQKDCREPKKESGEPL